MHSGIDVDSRLIVGHDEYLSREDVFVHKTRAFHEKVFLY